MFCIRNQGLVPWYVGKTEKRSFETGCFQSGTREAYNLVLNRTKRGTPLLFLLSRLTGAGDQYAKPTSSRFRDAGYLETRLIAIAFKRNPELLNIGTTSFLSHMLMPGIVNGRKGDATKAVTDLRTALGLLGG